MKNFSIIFVAVSVLIIFSLIFAFAYMLHAASSDLLLNKSIPLFAPQLFISGLFFFFPLACGVTIVWVFFYCIRKNLCNLFAWFLTTVIIASLWFVAIPSYFNMLPKINQFFPLVEPEINTDLYFFPEKSFQMTKFGIYYFVKVNNDNTVTGVRFPQPILGSADLKAYIFKDHYFAKNLLLTGDTKTSESLEAPNYMQFFYDFYKKALINGFKLYEKGFSSYILVCFMFFAFLGLWGFSFLSAWRLINILLVLLVTAGIIYLNYFLLATEYFQEIKNALGILQHSFLYSAASNILCGVIGVALFFIKLIYCARRV
ncbi:MAG: hypothetical protein ACRC5H_08030 [Treponemataceae bacterium]